MKKKGQSSKSICISLWIHTLRGILRQELMPPVKQMWGILLVGKPHWDRILEELCAEDLKLGIEGSVVSRTERHAKKILSSLPPKQIGQLKLD